MSDELEPSQASTQPHKSPEPWGAGWSWIVRLSGLAIILNQAFLEQQDRQWLQLSAMGMMLGEIGVKALLRFLARSAEQ